MEENLVDRLVAAGNFTSWVVLYPVGFAILYFLWKRCRLRFWNDSLDIVMAGAMIEAFSWAAHRQYWFIWRSLRQNGYDEHAKAFVDYGYLTLIPIFFAMIGAVMVLSPITSKYLEKTWFLYSVCFVMLVYSTYFFMS